VIEIGNYAVVIQTDQHTKRVCWKAKVKGKDELMGSFIGIAITRLSFLFEEFTSLYINFSFNSKRPSRLPFLLLGTYEELKEGLRLVRVSRIQQLCPLASLVVGVTSPVQRPDFSNCS